MSQQQQNDCSLMAGNLREASEYCLDDPAGAGEWLEKAADTIERNAVREALLRRLACALLECLSDIVTVCGDIPESQVAKAVLEKTRKALAETS